MQKTNSAKNTCDKKENGEKEEIPDGPTQSKGAIGAMNLGTASSCDENSSFSESLTIVSGELNPRSKPGGVNIPTRLSLVAPDDHVPSLICFLFREPSPAELVWLAANLDRKPDFTTDSENFRTASVTFGDTLAGLPLCRPSMPRRSLT
jgi:hypothetical protein